MNLEKLSTIKIETKFGEVAMYFRQNSMKYKTDADVKRLKFIDSCQNYLRSSEKTALKSPHLWHCA